MYKILIVDDEKMIRNGIRETISWDELKVNEVYTAGSAKEALGLVCLHHPEIIITDINMREMTGLEMIEEIRKINPNCRVIVLTGYDRFDYARQALQLRVQDFLLKPIDEYELTSCIKAQVDVFEEERIEETQRAFAQRGQGLRAQIDLDQCLRDYISGKIPEHPNEVFPKELLPYYEKGVQIGILLPEFSMTEQKKRDYFKEQTIRNVCMSVIDMQKKGITFSDQNNNIVIVFFTDHVGGYSSRKEVTQFVDLIESECEAKMRIVIGSSQIGFHNLYISYNDAILTLESEQKSYEVILKTSREQTRENLFLEAFQAFKYSIINNISNADHVLHVFERFQTAMVSYNLSNRDAVQFCFEMVSAAYMAHISENGSTVRQKLDDLLKSFYGATRENAGLLAKSFVETLLVKESKTEHEIIRKVKKSIQENLKSEITVASLAAEVYVSPNYLSRLFKRMTGEGCNEYIINKRIEMAKVLLADTSLKAGEIAVMVGYHDINYFSMAFKKCCNVSPIAYRRNIQQGEDGEVG